MNGNTETLVRQIQSHDAAKRDEIAPSRFVVCSPNGFLFKGKPIHTTGTAVRQLCAVCGIPAPFFIEKMNAGERAVVFNRLNLLNSEVEHMYRFNDNTLYGVVSPRYKKIDNVRILDVLQAASDSGVGLKPVRWTLSHDHTRVTLVPDKASVGELTPSITILNSECGLASLSLWSGVFRFVCSNGMLVPVTDITKSRWMHLGNNDITLPDIGVVLNRSGEYVGRLEHARTVYLDAGEKADIILDISRALGQRVAEKVTDVANKEYSGAPTMFHAINSITRAAQSFRPAQQTEMERFAATLLAA